jgi:hypothetical protein
MRGEPGTRVVLVNPRRGKPDGPALSKALTEFQRLGWTLAAVIDPDDHLDALRMIIDGVADVIVVTSEDQMPVLQIADF